MEKVDGKECIAFKSGQEFRAWLEKNYERKEGFFMIIFHKKSSKESIYYDEARDTALCYGWIDAVPKKRNHESSYLYFAPRNPKSNWSMVNKLRVAELEKEGLIHPNGRRLIDQAKESGTWTALDDCYNLVIHPDLDLALHSYPKAYENFTAFPPSAKRGILEWIYTAKRAETRAKRINETALEAAQNRRVGQWGKKG